MRKILTFRLFRFLVCLVLICALLINVSPIKARADVVSGGLVAAGATLVGVPVAVWAAAALIAIGVTVDWVADPNYNSFDALVDNVSTFLTNTGTYVKDGMVDMIRVVDETGKAVFYAAGDAMEAVRTWLFDSSTVELSSDPGIRYENNSAANSAIYTASLHNYALVNDFGDSCWVVWSDSELVLTLRSDGDYQVVAKDGSNLNVWRSNTGWITPAWQWLQSAYPIISCGRLTPAIVTDGAYTLGSVSSVPIDGTGARVWSEEYTNNGLYIVGTGGSGNNNPNDGKWFWPLAFGLTVAELYAMSQADQWAAETPAEFDQYETKEEFAVSPGTEVEFGQSIELSPSTDPDPGTGTDPDPGTGTNPGTGTDTDSGSSSWTPPSDMGKFTLDLKQYFPFCIPFDLYAFFTCLNAEPVAPVIEWIIPLPGGKTYPFEIDLSAFDSVAQILRRMQLLLFCVGLAFKTRDLIKV